jgi:hypothetical protein
VSADLRAAVPANGDRDWEAEALFRFRTLSRDDLDRLPPPDPVVEGLLSAKGSLATLAGKRALGKTLLAVSISASIATDLPTWTGMEVRHHGPVLYVSQEGFHGIPNRVRAWETWQQQRTDHIVWLPDPVDLKRPADAHQVGALARTLSAVMVVVDSARATGAGAEDTKDMGAYVHGLETVRDESGALVLVLHNSGLDGTRERGSTLLGDACDTVLILEGDPGGLRTLKHLKHRDGDMLPAPLGFAFRPVDGTQSGVLVPADTTQPATRRQRVLEYVQHNPGKATGAIADDLGLHRPNVSTDLTTLADAGHVRNDGTTNRPSWVAPGEDPLT